MTEVQKRAAAALFLVSVLSPLLRAADDHEILDKAARRYYDLKREGLVEFRMQVLPDWDALSKNLNVEASAADVLPLVKQTSFSVAVGQSGATTISHQGDAAPPNEQVAQRLRQILSGVEQVLTGFFQVSALFLHGIPGIDLDKDYKIVESNGSYQINQSQDPAEVLLSMNRELAVTQLVVTKPGLMVTVHPTLSDSPKGYLLTEFDSAVKTPSGTLDSRFVVEYQMADGFELPKALTVSMGRIEIHFHFSGYQVKRRNE